MLGISILSILALNLYPEKQDVYDITEYNHGISQYEEALEIPKMGTEEPEPAMGQPDRAPASIEPGLQDTVMVMNQEPYVLMMTKAEPDFDWKSAISWFIAASNGLVLLVLNLKKIKTKGCQQFKKIYVKLRKHN